MIERLRKVLIRLKIANLKINPKKCHLCLKQVKFLGHQIDQNGIKKDPSMVNVIKDWKIPETPKQLHLFVGLANYYKRFIRNFSTIIKPLYQLINVKPKDFKWEPHHNEAFETLKNLLTGDNILAYPNFNPPIGRMVLDTDASSVAIGGCLSQWQEGILRPIAFGSKVLNKAQQNYSTTQRELLSLVYFIEYWRHHLLGQDFLVRVDHSALKSLTDCKDRSKLYSRWLAILDNHQH